MEEKLKPNSETKERNKRRKVTQEEIDLIRTMVGQAKKGNNRNIVTEISEKLGIKLSTLYKILQREKIDIEQTIKGRRKK